MTVPPQARTAARTTDVRPVDLRSIPRPPWRPALVFRAAAASVAGPRELNEDSGCTGPGLIAVADGVGGNAGGEVASAAVVSALATAASTGPDHRPGQGLLPAVRAANEALGRAVDARPALRGMATTLTAAVLRNDDGGAAVDLVHVGDSRAYLLRAGQLVQLTDDHTLVAELIAAGRITPDEAHTHPFRSVLTAALHGSPGDLTSASTSTLPVLPGDRFLLCSDGLSSFVDDDVLERVLAEASGPESAVLRLLRDALVAPTRDNVTVVVADVQPARPSSGPVAAVVGAARPRGWEAADRLARTAS